MDWPHWRGPELNGISRERGLADRWSPDGENLLWKKPQYATRSTPIVMNGKLYVLVRDKPGTLDEGEKVVCLDAETGERIWENRFNVYLSDVPDTRVGWSSVVGDPETGNVFALGVCGYFQCLDGVTGRTLWSHSLCEEYGLLSTYGGRTGFPIVHDELVIVGAIIIGWGEMAKPAHRFLAFDKRNGEPVWFSGTRPLPYDTVYSSPITAVIEGQSLLVFGSGDGGVHAFQTRTGRPVWKYYASRRGINTTPVIEGTTVFCGHSEENLVGNRMGALFAIDATRQGDITKTGELWRVEEWTVGKSSPLVVDGRLYAVQDNGMLLIVDAKTGRLIARKKLGTMMRGSPIFADGKIYLCTANGRWYVLKPTAEGVEVVHRLRLSGEEVHGSPIVSHGRIYLPTSAALYC
ncbi:MAG TPA: pyrrolo-quinoline quinone, partial [Planctomycetaceae bacterium]|nr:pyrrolo-quinoline quinone [Planctomycetaceae bacterium]